jgi:hypothetical protein
VKTTRVAGDTQSAPPVTTIQLSLEMPSFSRRARRSALSGSSSMTPVLVCSIAMSSRVMSRAPGMCPAA